MSEQNTSKFGRFKTANDNAFIPRDQTQAISVPSYPVQAQFANVSWAIESLQTWYKFDYWGTLAQQCNSWTLLLNSTLDIKNQTQNPKLQLQALRACQFDNMEHN